MYPGTNTARSRKAPQHQSRLLGLATQLYDALTDGAPPAGFHLRRGCALRDARTKAPLPASWTEIWQPARELHADGTTTDRLLNPHVLVQHLQGHYDVAWTAPSWNSLVIFDIDRPAVPDDADPDAILAANYQRDQVLEQIWRAFDFGHDRQPVVLSTPGGGYHLYLPICRTRDPEARERTWPAAWARELFEHHLDRHGLDRRPGKLELYPSGVRLRAPCGRGTALLRPQNPAHGDDLQFELVDARELELIDGESSERRLVVRRAVARMVESFLAALEVQRRPIEEWLGSEGAPPAWSPRWGPFGDRQARLDSLQENPDSTIQVDSGPYQHSEDVSKPPSSGSVSSPGARPRGGAAAGGRAAAANSERPPPPLSPRSSGAERRVGAAAGRRAAAANSGGPPALPAEDGAAGRRGWLLRGAAFFAYVDKLWREGLAEPGGRHDAALKLAWYFGAVCGYERAEVLARIEEWLRAHPHQSGTPSHRFVPDTLREVSHYYDSRVAHCRPRGGGSRALDRLGRLLSSEDRTILSQVDEEARQPVEDLLRHLKAHASTDGRVPHPVHLPGTRLEAICGKRRIIADGHSRRAYVVAVEELVRLGVLTIHQQYLVGRHGRRYCCWYRFGSGVLPLERADGRLVVAERQVEEGILQVLSAGTAAPLEVALEPTEPRRAGAGGAPSSASSSGAPAPRNPDPPLGEPDLPAMPTPPGNVAAARADADELGDDDCPATSPGASLGFDAAEVHATDPISSFGSTSAAPPTPQEPWWSRMYRRRAFTPAEFLDGDHRKLIPGPFRHRWPAAASRRPATPNSNATAADVFATTAIPCADGIPAEPFRTSPRHDPGGPLEPASPALPSDGGPSAAAQPQSARTAPLATLRPVAIVDSAEGATVAHTGARDQDLVESVEAEDEQLIAGLPKDLRDAARKMFVSWRRHRRR